jgi:RNA recognition motif-containing protein
MDKSTIQVANLAIEADEEALRAAFIPFGEVKSVEIPRDPNTGKLLMVERYRPR